MEVIGTKWKPLLLFHLLENPLRSGILQSKIPAISNKMFTQSLRELERDNMVYRKVFPEVPPRVEYGLTKKGQTLKSILLALDAWGKTMHEE
ncbi:MULTISPECIES: helix-turn-helix domain-containing protein [Flavobacteriaceae]|uniref:winged helix-turn-helix transcriptional regulator n=1 Tax=Flavobacteriaceae TaxID=49546 RepID=UPI0010ADDBF5|nr:MULTISPECIES: helix-turn-helix domain-containing protein [Flavobacteriaceae]NJB36292.1 helix-turn-helix transcriptional regulator [Croceivirga sp. JEA036]TKD66574.1 helix-turn-helix transcriptional regulator [Flavobacterium sp. ASW18X]